MLFHTFARQGKLISTDTIVKSIQRDELTHVVLFQNIFKELRVENPELFTDYMYMYQRPDLNTHRQDQSILSILRKLHPTGTIIPDDSHCDIINIIHTTAPIIATRIRY